MRRGDDRRMTSMSSSTIQIRVCWMAEGGGIGASESANDTPGTREALRAEIDEGASRKPTVARWIDVKNVQPLRPSAAWGP